MLALLVAFFVTIALHILTMALTGRLCGLEVRIVSLGVGPTLLRVGPLRLGVLPFAGHVRFADADSLDPDGLEAAPDRSLPELPLPAQLAIVLSGCATLLVLAVYIAGAPSLAAAMAAPRQFLAGAMAPMSTAQQLIAQMGTTTHQVGFPVLLSLVAAKVAALNLLPLPGLNGGAACAMLGRHWRLDRFWPQAMTSVLWAVLLLSLSGWLLALLVFGLRA